MPFHIAAVARALVAVAALAATSPIQQGDAPQLCVTNATADALLFAVERRDGPRIVEPLSPDASLCLPDPDRLGGIVSVFEDAEAIEGCSRLVASGGDSLQRYAEFDRCAWASHSN